MTLGHDHQAGQHRRRLEASVESPQVERAGRDQAGRHEERHQQQRRKTGRQIQIAERKNLWRQQARVGSVVAGQGQDHPRLRIRFDQGHSVTKSAHHRKTASTSGIRIGGHLEVHREPEILIERKAEALRHEPHDLQGPPVDTERRPDDVGRRVEQRTPQPLPDGHVTDVRAAVLSRREGPPHEWRDPEQVERARRDTGRAYALGCHPRSDQGHPPPRVPGHLSERARTVTKSRRPSASSSGSDPIATTRSPRAKGVVARPPHRRRRTSASPGRSQARW